MDQVLGINRFFGGHYLAEEMPESSPFAPYNHGKFVKEDESLFVFMPSLLTQDARYMNAALE